MLKTILHRSWPLSYKVEGNGYPVMLLHGFAEDGLVWDGQVASLRDRYQLIIPDLPGSGRTPLFPDLPRSGPSALLPGSGPSTLLPGAVTLEELADLLQAILVAEGIDQTVLIGHSMGGYITLAFAEKYPDRLQAFGLFHSTAYADSDEKIAGRQKSIEFILRNGATAYIRQSMPNLFADHTRKQQPELIASLIDRYAGFNPHALAAYQQAMILRPDRTHVLQQARVPVLFIFGEQDGLLPLETSLRQSHLPSLAHIHLLANSGHIGMLEDKASSNRILDDFLQSLPVS